MGAVRMLARSELRRRWRSVVVLTLLVGISGAVVLALAAGARRTSSSLDRFEQVSRAANLELDVGDVTPTQIEEFAHTRGVAAVGRLRQLTLIDTEGGFAASAAPTDSSFGRVVDRARVVAGRRADPRRIFDLNVGEGLAERLHLQLGDRVSFLTLSPAQIEALANGAAYDFAPGGPRITLRVVGIVRRPLDLGGRGAAGGVLVLTPAFLERYRDEVGSFAGTILRVRTDHGARDVPEITRAARRIFGGSPNFSVDALGVEGAGARNAIDVTTVALVIAAGIAGVAALVGVGLALSREVSFADSDQLTLRALALRPRHRVAAAAAVGVPVALGGAALAALGSVLASSLFPIGVAAKAEPDLGIRVDGPVLVFGVLAVVAVVMGIAVLAGTRLTRAAEHPHRPYEQGPAVRAAGQLGVRPVMSIGVRFALDRGDGRRALPVRSSLAGAALGVTIVVAVLLLATSLDHLVSTPSAFGYTWDFVTTDSQLQDTGSDCGKVDTRLLGTKGVTAVASVCTLRVEVAGRPVYGLGYTDLRGRVGPGIVDGRAPATSDEVALGTETLDALGLSVGDTTKIAAGGVPRRYRIVGRAVMASVAEDALPLADGAVFTGGGVKALDESGATIEDFALLVRVAHGPANASAVARVRALARSDSPARSPTLPTEIERVRQIDGLPVVLGVFVSLVALVAVGYGLVTSVRRRRRDLAVLKTLGFRRNQVRLTIAWQATTIGLVGLVFGIPLGLIVGRFVWWAVADELGVFATIAWPAMGVAILVVSMLLAVNLVAAFPARRAARTRPAIVLRSE